MGKALGKVKEATVFEPLPQGLCFQNVFTFLKARGGLSARVNGKANIVHGLATNIEGLSFMHAWIEEGETVIDPTQGVSNPKKRVYELLKIKKVTVYTYEEALIKAVQAGHYGPWK